MDEQATQLLLKYLENKCSRDDLDTIFRMLGNRQQDEDLQTLLFAYWENTPAFQQRLKEDELNQILDSLHHRFNTSEQRTRPLVKKITFYAWRAAAILFIPLLAINIWTFLNDKAFKQENQPVTLETTQGSKLKTVLPDGTEVWLNAETKIEYPAKFSRKNRTVTLTGEAYFHVSSDPANPFYVKTADGTIKVTGTKFNVSAFPDDNFSSVVLEEGQIAYTPTSNGKNSIALHPDEQIIYLRESGSLSKVKTDVEKYTSWTEGRLVFRNDPLSTIITRLERWYHAEIILSDPEHVFGSMTFTMTVRHETLPQVLEYLSRAANLSFREEFFENPGNSPGRTRYLLSGTMN